MNKSIFTLSDIPTIEQITKAMLFHHGEPYATSNLIAKYFGKPHNDLLKKIRSFHSFEELIRLGKVSQQTRILRGREYPFFELDADAFAFTCLSITGKKAEAFKWAFIEAFKKATLDAISTRVAIQVNKANQKWLEARGDGKTTRKLFQDKIKEFCNFAEKQRGRTYNKKCPYYKLVTDAIYAYIGIDIPQCGKTPRDVYPGDIVETIEAAELKAISLLDEVMDSNGSRKGIKDLILERLANE